MAGLARYLRLLLAFARFGLANELAFRANFLVKITVEVLWLAILLVFYQMIFDNTRAVAGWTRYEYLFFLGCFYALGGIIETFFLGNCTEFAELVRSGNLDAYLLRPIDEQFLVTCRWIDWSTAPNILLGVGIMTYALARGEWAFDGLRLAAFGVVFAAGTAMAYSFLLLLASTSVWLVRNQNLMEMWWLFTTLMRYPRQIFQGAWAAPLGWFFTFIIPVLLVVNVPADTMVKVFSPLAVLLTIAVSLALLYVSRRFFLFALKSYRSASS